VRLIFCAFGDPLPQQILLRIAEFLVRIRRRHQIVFVGGENAVDQLALIRFAGDNRAFLQGDFADIKPEFRFARPGAASTLSDATNSHAPGSNIFSAIIR
jgi:hypothetical protein